MNTEKELEIIEAMMRKSSQKKTVEETVVNHSRAQNNASEPAPIAIIGVDSYFPQCMSVTDFWQALDEGRSLLSEIPDERFAWDKIFTREEMSNLKDLPQWGGFIPDIAGFDAAFFQISDADAEKMDPRLRLLLMSVYHCLENAGYAPQSFNRSRTGLFIGVEDSEYQQNLQELGINTGLENAPGMIANRVSYFFDFWGPSEFINTMCSGAAVAIHRAVTALRAGEISQAVVGAANILLRPEPFMALWDMGQMSSDNTVASFGQQADGYVRGDGVASILLKPLAQAQVDGDAVYAVIKHSAVNYNGQGGMSIATPNIASHTALIKRCYQEAQIDVSNIHYIEAQGMGTPVSDIAEWNAFNRALQALAQEQKVSLTPGQCKISTLKPMLGHMHATSSLGALLKIIHSFQTNTIYEVLNFNGLSNDLDNENVPCSIAASKQNWGSTDKLRLAGLHSYGLGGNNAHILLEEYKVTNSEERLDEQTVVIPLSADTLEQCRQLVQQLLDYTEQYSDVNLQNMAYTLQIGRNELTTRVAFVSHNIAEWIQQAKAFLAGKNYDGVLSTEASEAGNKDNSNKGFLSAGEAWVKGESVNWQKIRPKHKLKRLHLPTYPFAVQPYWIDFSDLEYFASVKKSLAIPILKFSEISDEMAVSRKEKLQYYIMGFLATAMSISRDSIDPKQHFQHFGMDSIVVMKLMRNMETEIGIKLTGREMLNCPTIDDLVCFIDKRMDEEGMIGATESDSESSIDSIEALLKFKAGELDIEEAKALLQNTETKAGEKVEND